MKLTNKQAHLLLVLLQDSIKMDVANYLSISFQERVKLLQEIVNQQDDKLIELSGDTKNGMAT